MKWEAKKNVFHFETRDHHRNQASKVNMSQVLKRNPPLSKFPFPGLCCLSGWGRSYIQQMLLHLPRRILRNFSAFYPLSFSHIYFIPKKAWKYYHIIDVIGLNRFLEFSWFQIDSAETTPKTISHRVGCIIKPKDVCDSTHIDYPQIPFILSQASWAFTRVSRYMDQSFK